MPSLDLFGPATRETPGRPQNVSRLVNVYRVPSERSGAMCLPVPGMRRVATLDGALMRAMLPVRDRLMVAHGGGLWRLGAGFAPERLRAIADAADTSLATMDGAVLIAAGGAYQTWTTAGAVSDPDMAVTAAFASVGSVTVVAQRAVLTERNGRRVQWSAPADPVRFDALDFATAEQRDEPIIRALAVGPELWVFKGTHLERWAPTGDDRGFQYLPGSLLEFGLAGFNLLAETPRGAFFVAQDGRAYLGSGAGVQGISTAAVESALAAEPPHRVLFTRYEARDVVAVLFRNRPAWCCDLATGEWHERAQGNGLGAWQAVTAAELARVRYVGDDTGGLFALDAVGEDDGAFMTRVMVSRSIMNDGRSFRVPRFEALAHTGLGALADAALGVDVDGDALSDGALDMGSGALLAIEAEGRGPVVTLRVSHDEGQTWGVPRPRSLGRLGENRIRLCWRALGRFRSFTAELRCAEPTPVAFDASALVDLV